MNVKLVLLATGFVTSAGALMLYFNQSQIQHVSSNSIEAADTKSTDAITAPDQSVAIAAKNLSGKSANPMNVPDSNLVANEAGVSSTSASAEQPFYQSLGTEQDINSAYIRQDDAIYQTTLLNSFKAQDFAELIESLSAVERGSDSLENEQQLSSYLMQQYGSIISNEKYSCAGRICAVMFNYLPDADKEKLKNLHNYGTHYSFYNDSIDEYDNPVMKAIFVSTDDPSKLTIVR